MKKRSIKQNTGKEIRRKIMAYTLILLVWAVGLPMLPTSSINAQTPDEIWKMRESESLNPSAGPVKNEKTSARLKKYADQKFSNESGSADQTRLSQPVGQAVKYLFVNVEFTDQKAREAVFPANKTSRIEGVSVLTLIDRFADVFISSDAAFERLAKTPGVFWMDGFEGVTAPPPPPSSISRDPSKAVPERIVRGGYREYKGKNVIIAIVDSGVDFRHPDFITYDADGKPTSRLLYLWDTGLDYQTGRGNPASFSFPNKAPIGTVFTKNQLTAELRSSTETIPANDLGGHGTACASIAAGNGNADMGEGGLKRGDVVGVAPEADIIGVSLDAYKNDELGGAYLMNAISEWLDQVAGANPLVVSNSWGGHYNGHDGQSVYERQLDARYPLDKKGRAILFAAGNEGEDEFHATVQVSGQKRVFVEWVTDAPYLDAYFNTNDWKDIGIAPAGDTSIRFADGYPEINPITDQVVANFYVNEGFGGIYLFSRTGKAITADLYLYGGARFNSAVRNSKGLVGSPGTMRNAITVGSYDWNDNFHTRRDRVTILPGLGCQDSDSPLVIGNISCYSSPGPTRDGRIKPEVASPGQYFTSSHAKIDGRPVAPDYADTTGNYILMNGTSAATPYTAGIVALMFEKKRDLTLGEIKELLRKNASRDPSTGIPPSSVWGSGKLDMRAVDKIFAGIR